MQNKIYQISKILIFIFTISLLNLSCGNSTNPDIDDSAPDVKGVINIDKSGQQLGPIGNPSENGVLHSGYNDAQMLIPRPNPIINLSQFAFYTLFDQQVTVYFSPAKSIPKSKYGTGTDNIYGYGASKIFGVISQYCPAGVYGVNININYNEFTTWPDGYYRLYLKTKNNLYWQDVMFSRN